MLLPNNKQNTKLFECANAARYAYNWAIAKEQENYNSYGKFTFDSDLRKEFVKLKRTEEFSWLGNASCNITKQAIKDACNAYMRFFKHQSGYPKFKSKKKSKPSFYVDNLKIEFSSTHVKLEKIADGKRKNRAKANWIKLAEKDRVPINSKYSNPRCIFDGLNWWIVVGIECDVSTECIQNNGVGIDVGIKDLAICSNGDTYKNINKTARIKSIKKKQLRLKRVISRKYRNNKNSDNYKKTTNIIKREKQLLKTYHQLRNIRHNYLHQTTTQIIKRKPSFIVLEDLNIKGMMKNHHLARAIQEQCLYEFYRQLQYKSQLHNINFITANRFFPSSKTCYMCGNIKTDLKLSDRIYKCSECGNVIDRDYQASLNLAKYGELIA